MDNALPIISEQAILDRRFTTYSTLENPLFRAKDIAEWLGYDTSKVSQMLEAIDEDEKGRYSVPTLGGIQQTWFLTEDGVYEVLMQSRKPIAKQFKQEVKRILKEIRTTGMSATDRFIEQALADPDFAIQALMRLKEERTLRMQAQQEVAELIIALDESEFRNEQLEIQLDESKQWYTVKRVAEINNISWRTIDWRTLKQASQNMSLLIQKVFDANYGQVNAYHEDVWSCAYPHLHL